MFSTGCWHSLSLRKSYTGTGNGAPFSGVFCKAVRVEGMAEVILPCFPCDRLQFSLHLAKQPQCFQFFLRMWFLSSLAIPVIHFRMHRECLYCSGLLIYVVRYCFAKNPTARIKVPFRGLETTIHLSYIARFPRAGYALAPLNMM